ncbi:MAG: hypothetical protein ACYTG1_08645 [Planctomycetota bacterium]
MLAWPVSQLRAASSWAPVGTSGARAGAGAGGGDGGDGGASPEISMRSMPRSRSSSVGRRVTVASARGARARSRRSSRAGWSSLVPWSAARAAGTATRRPWRGRYCQP